ncbi:MAG: glycosyltransferase [Gemmatimonadetes bacterium]|nr:glycosyltransferase [Gemmatimonadota bacterium]
MSPLSNDDLPGVGPPPPRPAPTLASRALDTDVSRAIPPATPPRSKRTLCIGMSTYDDYDGVFFSIQAIRMYHPEILDEIEILVVDNHPTGPAAPALKSLDETIENYRYVPNTDVIGSVAKDAVFGEANADFVLVMDCHVLFPPGVLRRLIDYFRIHPETNDLLQGPLLRDDLGSVATHFEEIWDEGFFGRWGTDPRGTDPDGAPFEIRAQGTGAFACRREAWPGFNRRMRGFGAEEGYIHEKFRRAGGRTLCLPFLRWMHRFARPLGAPYPMRWGDRIRNHLIGWNEVGLDTSPVRAHFADLLGQVEVESLCTAVENEIHSHLFGFDAVYYLSAGPSPTPNRLERQIFERLYIAERVIVIDVPVEADPEVGRLLGYRNAMERARKARVESVLVIERLDEMGDDALETLRCALPSLRSGDAGRVIVTTEGDSDPPATVAIAGGRRMIEAMTDLPGTVEDAVAWVSRHERLERFALRSIGPRTHLDA